MPLLVHRLPKYRKHKASGQAMVTIHGRDLYLGPFNSLASRREYDRLIRESLSGGGLPGESAEFADLTINELTAQFWDFVENEYVRADGSQTQEVYLVSHALRPLLEVYGDTPVREFGPKRLSIVREQMIQHNWSRNTINKHVCRIRRMFQWGVRQEIVPVQIHQALCCVQGLRAGRSKAKDNPPVRPVAGSTLATTLPYLSRQVSAMVRLQALTGARPGEICSIKTGQINRSRSVWICRPHQHKTAYLGHDHLIFIGPRGQEILKPFLKLDPEALRAGGHNPAAPLPSPNPSFRESSR